MRPQPSLHRVLDDLGATLHELVCAPSVASAVGGADESALPRRALVLDVGARRGKGLTGP